MPVKVVLQRCGYHMHIRSRTDVPYPANLRLHIYIVAEVNDQHIVSISILLRPLLLLRSRSVVDLLSEGLHRIIFTSFGASIFHKRDQSEMVAFLAEPDVPIMHFHTKLLSRFHRKKKGRYHFIIYNTYISLLFGGFLNLFLHPVVRKSD